MIISQPPKNPLVPQVPAPNTSFGVLEQFGNSISDLKPLPGHPPDFSEFTSRGELTDIVELTTSTEVGSIFYGQNALNGSNNKSYGLTILPRNIPFKMSQFYNTEIQYTFTAIKPVGTFGGRIQVIYFPQFTEPYSGSILTDSQQREVIKEWDLNETNVCSVRISGFPSVLSRMTWLPEVPIVSTTYLKTVGTTFATLDKSFGYIALRLVQAIQPGSLYPEGFSILVQTSFPNFQCSTITNFQGTGTHTYPITT